MKNCYSIKDTPHSELRFRTELNQRTSNSGHRIRRHIIESISIVNPEKNIHSAAKIFSKVLCGNSITEYTKVTQRNIPMHIRAVLTQYFTASKRETDLLCK